MKRLLAVVLILATLLALGWAAFYFHTVFILGSFIHWRFTPLDWAEAIVVGVGPMALSLVIGLRGLRRLR